MLLGPTPPSRGLRAVWPGDWPGCCRPKLAALVSRACRAEGPGGRDSAGSDAPETGAQSRVVRAEAVDGGCPGSDPRGRGNSWTGDAG
jgi:hypothetical protein